MNQNLFVTNNEQSIMIVPHEKMGNVEVIVDTNDVERLRNHIWEIEFIEDVNDQWIFVTTLVSGKITLYNFLTNNHKHGFYFLNGNHLDYQKSNLKKLFAYKR